MDAKNESYRPSGLLYCSRDMYGLPAFSFSYYRALRHWLHLGFSMSYYARTLQVSSVDTKEPVGNQFCHLISPMAAIRFQYLDRPIVGLYSGLALGVTISPCFTVAQPKTQCFVAPAFQLTALGLRVGNRVYWTTELGFGDKGFVCTGIGARF